MNIITAQNIIYKEPLTLKAQAIFTYLADRSNKENICWPGLKKIAADCRISVSTVQRAIKELLGLGLLMKKPNYRENGSQTSNIYIITENLEQKEDIKTENHRLQRKIQEKMKRQARKEKLVAMFTKEIQENKCIETISNYDNKSLIVREKASLTHLYKTKSTIKNRVANIVTLLKKINAPRPLNFNFLPWGVFRKTNPEPKHINYTY